MVTVSGLIYNLGLVVGPWFEGQLAQCLLGILNGNETLAAMVALCAGYLIAIAVVQGSRFIKRLYVRKFANNINRSMKQVLYANLVRKDKAELEQAGTGTLMTKAISDVDACAEGMRKFTTEIFDTGIALLAYAVMLLGYDWRLDEYNMVVNQLANFLDIYTLGMGAALLYVWLVQRYPAAEKRKAMAWQGIATLLCVLSTWGMLRIFRVQAGESGQAVLQAGQMMRRPLLGLAVAGILLTLPFAARPLRFLMGNRVMGWLAAVSMNYYLLHQNLAVHLKRLGVPPSVSAEPNRAGEQPWQLQYTLLCFGLSLLGAALITLLIEKPCAKVLKKMFARGKAENKA